MALPRAGGGKVPSSGRVCVSGWKMPSISARMRSAGLSAAPCPMPHARQSLAHCLTRIGLLRAPCCPLQPRDPKRDPQVSEAKNLMRRKRVQLEHAREYDEAVVSLKTKVKELEGQDMRETIQDKVRGAGGAGRPRCAQLGEELGGRPLLLRVAADLSCCALLVAPSCCTCILGTAMRRGCGDMLDCTTTAAGAPPCTPHAHPLHPVSWRFTRGPLSPWRR